MARGGYRAPANPAPVSGPGALSQRTDGGPSDKKQAIRALPNAKYGEGKEFEEIQGGAPMAQQQQPELPPLTPLDAPSARPGEAVTSGADAGAGPGSESLGIPSEDAGDLQSILAYLPVLEFMANQPSASPSTRALIRRIKSQI